ncbi:MAG: 16S rRNA (adenine(1518)-N(6)/adenine(1519)-N(6))-dimethyltransferase RsmA, partial [Gammaproteobacteria bacterium]
MNRGRHAPQSPGQAHRPRKRFGQNFLHDRQVIDRIIDAIDPQQTDHILEVGPGQGALTGQLIASGARLDSVELDRDLASYLLEYYRHANNFTLHQQDILKFDIASICSDERGLRVVGNLPYNISTPVLFHLLANHRLIRDMVFMLQLEVVQRMGARVGEKNYGRLGLMLQYYCQVEHLFNVPSAAFTPRPRVSAAHVRLNPHPQRPVKAPDEKNLARVI